MIALREVHKVYRQGANDVAALAGVSLEVAGGEFVSIMGPSGSGKSTLLHLMGGLDLPTAGDVRIGDASIARMTDDEVTIFRRRKIGFVFQFFNLLPTLSAEENVALPLALDRRPTKEIRPRVQAALEQVGLAARRHHKPDELSGGEMQRVAIARALVIEPQLILYDEPTSELDPLSAVIIGEEILRLQQRIHVTSLVVSHDRDLAFGVADRIAVIDEGNILAIGAPDEVKRHPDPRVQTFLHADFKHET